MPDVGSLHHMARLPDQLGTMLALTGYRLTASSLTHAGLATHFCRCCDYIISSRYYSLALLRSSALLPGLRTQLLGTGGSAARVQELLDTAHTQSGNTRLASSPALNISSHQ